MNFVPHVQKFENIRNRNNFLFSGPQTGSYILDALFFFCHNQIRTVDINT